MKFLCAMKASKLREIFDWCRTVYLVTFGPVEGEARFRKLTLVNALALYKSGDGKPLRS